MRRPLNIDALVYCILWAVLAIYVLYRAGVFAGLVFSIGLFPVVMGSSILILSRTGNFAAEQAVRWGLLAVAAIALMSYLDLHP